MEKQNNKENANNGSKFDLNTKYGWNQAVHPFNNIQQERYQPTRWFTNTQRKEQSRYESSANEDWRVPVKESHGNVALRARTDGRPITKKLN